MWKHAVAQLVEALRYIPEGLGFDPDFVIGIFHRHNPSGPRVDSDPNKK